MKAIFLVPGPDGGVYEYREVPAPSDKGDLVVVKVRAAGTNRGELLARAMFRSSNPALKPMPAVSSSPAKSRRWAPTPLDGMSASA
jgi:NADPH:quinone reductase-like Zn-dependent oxidoreductase